jgi:hypothetical protein
MWYQWLRKATRYYIFGLMALAIVATVISLSGVSILEPKACALRPEYLPSVAEADRQQVDALFDAGLLYCKELREGLATVAPDLYWGSDGMSSLLFFQALPGESLSDVGVSAYAFGDGEGQTYPSRAGDRRHPRFSQLAEGRRVWSNQAEGGDGVRDYYLRRDAAPAIGEVNVYVKIIGPSEPDAGLTDRNFLRDLEQIWTRFRGGQTGSFLGARVVGRDTTFVYVPERWEPWVAREINPALLNEEGELDYQVLHETQWPEVMLYQSVQGILGSSVWVAGVVSGTTPAMWIQVPGETEAIVPEVATAWVSTAGGSGLALFSFARLESGRPYEAQYWADPAAQKGGRPPDKSWPVVFGLPEAMGAPEAGE